MFQFKNLIVKEIYDKYNFKDNDDAFLEGFKLTDELALLSDKYACNNDYDTAIEILKEARSLFESKGWYDQACEIEGRLIEHSFKSGNINHINYAIDSCIYMRNELILAKYYLFGYKIPVDYQKAFDIYKDCEENSDYFYDDFVDDNTGFYAYTIYLLKGIDESFNYLANTFNDYEHPEYDACNDYIDLICEIHSNKDEYYLNTLKDREDIFLDLVKKTREEI